MTEQCVVVKADALMGDQDAEDAMAKYVVDRCETDAGLDPYRPALLGRRG